MGKLSEATNAAGRLTEHVARVGFEFLDITLEHAYKAGRSPGPHRDPFDRILIAQGQLEGLPIVTRDPAFADYDVEVIW
jgi:PIN domain nuclease of toxin-antitoxin system